MKQKIIRSWVLATICALAGSGAYAQSSVTGFQRAMSDTIRLDPARGPLRPVDFSLLKGKVTSEILAGPINGLDDAYILYTRLAPGAQPLGLYTLPVEQSYVVLSGKLNVQIGTRRFVAEPDTLVLIPPGVPHETWNAGAEPETDLEVVAPAPSRSLVGMMRPAQPQNVADAAQLIHVPPPLGKLVGGTGHASLNERQLADRKLGSKYLFERLGEVLPGSGSEPLMIHPFDQIYFVRRGKMFFHYGFYTYEVPANALFVIPNGVVHEDTNKGDTILSYVQLNLPQPKPGVPFGRGVAFKKPPQHWH
jgi:mannose-6-phosphate isomerase-like protein (cupin superfamily)